MFPVDLDVDLDVDLPQAMFSRQSFNDLISQTISNFKKSNWREQI